MITCHWPFWNTQSPVKHNSYFSQILYIILELRDQILDEWKFLIIQKSLTLCIISFKKNKKQNTSNIKFNTGTRVFEVAEHKSASHSQLRLDPSEMWLRKRKNSQKWVLIATYRKTDCRFTFSVENYILTSIPRVIQLSANSVVTFLTTVMKIIIYCRYSTYSTSYTISDYFLYSTDLCYKSWIITVFLIK